MFDCRVRAAKEHCLDCIAARQRQSDVRAQRMLTILAKPKQFGLLALGHIAEHDHRAHHIASFNDRSAVVFDWKSSSVALPERVRVSHRYSPVHKSQNRERIVATL